MQGFVQEVVGWKVDLCSVILARSIIVHGFDDMSFSFLGSFPGRARTPWLSDFTNNCPCGGEVTVLIVCVCLSVCYRSSGRYAYSTGPTKVPTESAGHKDQNKRRNRAKTS